MLEACVALWPIPALVRAAAHPQRLSGPSWPVLSFRTVRATTDDSYLP